MGACRHCATGDGRGPGGSAEGCELCKNPCMTAVKDLSVAELEELIAKVVRRTLQDYLEDRDALASQQYLDSIEEARGEYRAGQATPLRDLRGD
jgi:hypothetical protein